MEDVCKSTQLASAMSGKSQYVQEEDVRVVASAESMGGDSACLLYDCSLEDYEKNGLGYPRNLVSDVASSYAGASPAIRPRLFDAVMQQITRSRPRHGGEARFQGDPQYRCKGAGMPGGGAEAGEWMTEEQLAVLQMDDVTIGVTIDECVNLGSDGECALVDGYYM